MVRTFYLLPFFIFFSGYAQIQQLLQQQLHTQDDADLAESISTKKKDSEKQNRSLLKVVGGVAVPMFVLGEYMMYSYFIKATYHWLTHGKEARSFFATQPVGATYKLKVTIKRFTSSKTYSFKSKNPKKLIIVANAYVTNYIKKEYQNALLVRILLEPRIITRQGKVIVLSPFYNLWSTKTALSKELRKKFFSTTHSNADQVFEAVQLFTVGSLMALTAPLLVAAAYRLRGTLFNNSSAPEAAII